MSPNVPKSCCDHGPPEEIFDKPVVGGQSQEHPDDGGGGEGDQRVQMEQEARPVGRIHADHQEFAVGKVDDVHDAEDDREPKGHQGKEKAHQGLEGWHQE